MREEIKIKILQNILKEVTKKYDYFISKQQDILEKTFEKAIRDSLTGLYNKQYLFEYGHNLEKQHRKINKPFVIVFFDLDNFKEVNDKEGHPKGDKILKELGKIFREVFEFDWVFRYGGDEFVVISEDSLSEIERRIRLLEEKIATQFREYKLGISSGIAIFPTDGKKFEELLKLADSRMYKNKLKKKKKLSISFPQFWKI
ncbi:MAG: hypothetical protein C6I01_02660 [Epsilonproteobacteria bacterium]|nr:hypothetical protein [Campylobacterota bacterium]NPA89571.1 GGDEF domain-containing protein [Campylobacterota bacterium]